jgi:hypothetical protein
VAFVAPWRAHRSAHLVARAQLAAADLGGRDIDVVARLPGRVDTHEAAAVGEDVEGAGRELLLALGRAALLRFRRFLGRLFGSALGGVLRGVL